MFGDHQTSSCHSSSSRERLYSQNKDSGTSVNFFRWKYTIHYKVTWMQIDQSFMK